MSAYGFNALLATVSTDQIAPVIAAQRLRKGSVGSPRGAVRLATDASALIGRCHLAGRDVLVRADSAFYSHALVTAVLKAGGAQGRCGRVDHREQHPVPVADPLRNAGADDTGPQGRRGGFPC